MAFIFQEDLVVSLFQAGLINPRRLNEYFYYILGQYVADWEYCSAHTRGHCLLYTQTIV